MNTKMEKRESIKALKLLSLVAMMVAAIVLAACDSESTRIFLGTKMAAGFLIGAVCCLGHRWQEDIQE